KAYSNVELDEHLRLVASPTGTEGSVTIHTDALLYAGRFSQGASSELKIGNGRHAWVQVARGRVRINDHELQAGDGAALSEVSAVRVEGLEPSEVLVFDLA
ncbi:MAG TPA: pirin family protein, partial [Polyangiaceae bacterium]